MLRFKNNRISICRSMTAPPETVWDILTDSQLWPIWGPSVFAVDCQDRHIRQGSKGRVQTLFSFWLPFTVSEFRDLDFWSWRIGSYNATGHTLIRTTNTSSTLCFDVPLWAAAYLPLCWLALLRIEKIISRR